MTRPDVAVRTSTAYEQGRADGIEQAREAIRTALTVDEACARLAQLAGEDTPAPEYRQHCDECGGLVREDR